MNAVANFLYKGVCRSVKTDYLFMVQWLKSIYHMTEFTRELIPILVLDDESTVMFLNILQGMYADGYAEPITNAIDINQNLINQSLVIPVLIDDDNLMDIKMALLDYHSCMSAGKFVVIVSKIAVASKLMSSSFKIIGQLRMLPGNMDTLILDCEESLKKGGAIGFSNTIIK